MGAAAKALSGLGQEFSGTGSGLQARLTPTLVSALPVSLSTAIPATSLNGERLAIAVYNHTAAGTIGVAGTAPWSAAVVSETSSSIPTLEQPGEVAWYVTSAVYGAVNASGVTLGSGLTGGSVAIWGIQAATRLIPGEVKLMDKFKEHSPVEQRGTYDEDFHLLALSEDPEWEYAADFYADVALFAYLGGYAADATVATIPATPVVILTAAQDVSSGSTASATNQPTAPGMVIAVQLTGTTPATAATVSITGANIFGETVTEVVVPSTKVKNTWVSSNIFQSIAANGIVWGAFGAGATMSVTGIFGYQYSNSQPSDTLMSFALEQYDSTGSFVAPFCLINEWSVEGGAEKEAKVTAKGPCQQVLPVGNPATTTNQITAFGQPLDKPLTGWRAIIDIDGLTGTMGTTQQPDVLDWKITPKINWVAKHTSWGIPPTRMWNRAYRKRRTLELELTLDMTSSTFQNEYQAWKRRKKRLVQITLRGPLLGVDGGTTYYEGAQFNLPVRWLDTAERDFTTGKDSVEVKLKGRVEYEPSLGYSHLITWWTRIKSW